MNFTNDPNQIYRLFAEASMAAGMEMTEEQAALFFRLPEIPETISPTQILQQTPAPSTYTIPLPSRQEPSPSPDVGSGDESYDRQVSVSRHINSIITHFTGSKVGYQRLLQELDDLLLVLDPQFKILFSNGASQKMLGVNPEDLTNLFLTSLLHPDDQPFVTDELTEAGREKRDVQVYARMKKNPTWVLVDVKVRPHVKGDTIQYYVASCREYRNKANQSVDHILELSMEHQRLRKQLEQALKERGMDPNSHPLLRDPETEPLQAEILNAEEEPPKKKKDKGEIFCRQCGTTSSPEWRRGPDGPKTLCNACGLAYSKKQKRLARARGTE